MATPSRSLPAVAVAVAVAVALALAAPAQGYWLGLGSGTGTGSAATMPAGNQPSATAAGQSVTVSWPQSSFRSSPLGAFGGGGYTIRRYAGGDVAPITPNAGCATPIVGAGTTLQCVEAGVPYGTWQYDITPVLSTFTGSPSTRSATVSVVTAAPVLSAASAQNPTSAQTTGDIQLGWGAVSGATGYNVYRRTSAGSFDFSAPLNGATPLSAGTAYTDSGAGLAAATTYHYVVRAVAGSPAVESASSSSTSAATISRPAAPASVTATAAAAARVDVAWATVPGVAGYNVYRRAAAGSFDFASPLNGATPVASTAYADLTAVHATTYRYAVRAVIAGAGGARVESSDSPESAPVTSDGVAPPAPTAAAVVSGGNIWSSTNCGVSSGTRYVNASGASATGVSATIAAPEAGQAVVFSATTPGSTAVTATVPASATTVTATLDLRPLLDGTLTLTARTRDLAGNLSATRSPTNVVVKDVVVPPLTAGYSAGFLGLSPTVSGSSECGAEIVAVRRGNANYAYAATATANGSYSMDVNGSLLGLGTVVYDVTATDRAGNVGPGVAAS